MEWRDLLRTRTGLGSPEEVLRTLCFGGAYVDALLRGYGFDDHSSQQLVFARKLGGYAVEWTLGAQIFYNTDPHHRGDEAGEADEEVRLRSDAGDQRGSSPSLPHGRRRRWQLRRRIRRLRARALLYPAI